LGRATDKVRLAAAYNRESQGLDKWFQYFSVLVAILLVA
jgi:hypothetical protein